MARLACRWPRLTSVWLVLVLGSCWPASGIADERGSHAAPSAAPRRSLTRLSLPELQALRPSSRAALRRALQTEGAVLLTDVPGFSDAAAETLDELGDCFREARAVSADAAVLGGPVRSAVGGAERWTVATSTVAGAPRPLPTWLDAACPKLAVPAARLRTLVSLLLSLFARSADSASAPDDAAEEELPVRGARGGQLAPKALRGAAHSRSSLEEVVRQGTFLEHFHRYTRTGLVQHEETHALRMHTDAGVLQALAVQWRSVDGELRVGHGLEVELPGGQVVSADEELAGMPAGSRGGGAGLLFLLGQGAQEWLPHLQLKAAPHAVAVPDSVGAERLVYGVMVLPPQDWPLVPAAGAGNTTFGEWWQRAQQVVASAADEVESGSHAATAPGCFSADLLQRRLQDQASSCPAGSIYCWMQCQQVPAELACGSLAAVCVSGSTQQICAQNEGHDASCKPACPSANDLVFEVSGAGETLAQTRVVEANGAYKADSWSGGKRLYRSPPPAQALVGTIIQWDPTYRQWVLFAPGYRNGTVLYYSSTDSSAPPSTGWQTYHGSPPAPTLRYLGGSGQTQMTGSGFCSGVLTDMHMGGFVLAGVNDPCVVYLFPGWHLTDKGRFWGAAAGTVAIGIFAEYLVALRRWDSERRPLSGAAARRAQAAYRLVLYAATRSLGYIVMLVSMIYSVELFIAVIVGLTLGHAIFNASAPPGHDMTPCCQTGQSDLEAKQQLHFKVTGMTCESCTRTVRRAVEAVDSVQRVDDINVSTGAMRVSSGSTSPRSRAACAGSIVSAVESVGFSARAVGLWDI